MADVDVYLKSRQPHLSHELTARLTAKQTKHVMSYHSDAQEAVSLTMPLRNESYAYDGLHPIFQMNLPEGVLREAIERATAKHYGSDDLTLLTILGDHQIGRLGIVLEITQLLLVLIAIGNWMSCWAIRMRYSLISF